MSDPAPGRLRDRLREAGAELVERRGAAVPADFGDVEAEYEALRGSGALVDDSRAVLRIRGSEAREHFGGLVTNHVEALEPGRGLYAFMLTPKGRPVAEMRVLAREPAGDDEVLWADLPASCLDSALDHLGRYLPPRLASYEVDASIRRLGVVGPSSARALGAAGLGGLPDVPLSAAEADPDALGGAATVVRREEIEGPGYDLYLPADGLAEAWDALSTGVREVGGRPAGFEAREIWRVERGVPVYGAEIDTDVLPQETGQEARAVDHEKGCYTGQEVVARIHYRGQVNRHLRGLRFDPASPDLLPAAGTELFSGGRSRATVTTAVRSPRLGPVALGYVRRELDPGDDLALEPDGDPVCRVVELPFG